MMALHTTGVDQPAPRVHFYDFVESLSEPAQRSLAEFLEVLDVRLDYKAEKIRQKIRALVKKGVLTTCCQLGSQGFEEAEHKGDAAIDTRVRNRSDKVSAAFRSIAEHAGETKMFANNTLQAMTFCRMGLVKLIHDGTLAVPDHDLQVTEWVPIEAKEGEIKKSIQQQAWDHQIEQIIDAAAQERAMEMRRKNGSSSGVGLSRTKGDPRGKGGVKSHENKKRVVLPYGKVLETALTATQKLFDTYRTGGSKKEQAYTEAGLYENAAANDGEPDLADACYVYASYDGRKGREDKAQRQRQNKSGSSNTFFLPGPLMKTGPDVHDYRVDLMRYHSEGAAAIQRARLEVDKSFGNAKGDVETPEGFGEFKRITKMNPQQLAKFFKALESTKRVQDCGHIFRLRKEYVKRVVGGRRDTPPLLPGTKLALLDDVEGNTKWGVKGPCLQVDGSHDRTIDWDTIAGIFDDVRAESLYSTTKNSIKRVADILEAICGDLSVVIDRCKEEQNNEKRIEENVLLLLAKENPVLWRHHALQIAPILYERRRDNPGGLFEGEQEKVFEKHGPKKVLSRNSFLQQYKTMVRSKDALGVAAYFQNYADFRQRFLESLRRSDIEQKKKAKLDAERAAAQESKGENASRITSEALAKQRNMLNNSVAGDGKLILERFRKKVLKASIEVQEQCDSLLDTIVEFHMLYALQVEKGEAYTMYLEDRFKEAAATVSVAHGVEIPRGPRHGVFRLKGDDAQQEITGTRDFLGAIDVGSYRMRRRKAREEAAEALREYKLYRDPFDIAWCAYRTEKYKCEQHNAQVDLEQRKQAKGSGKKGLVQPPVAKKRKPPPEPAEPMIFEEFCKQRQKRAVEKPARGLEKMKAIEAAYREWDRRWPRGEQELREEVRRWRGIKDTLGQYDATRKEHIGDQAKTLYFETPDEGQVKFGYQQLGLELATKSNKDGSAPAGKSRLLAGGTAARSSASASSQVKAGGLATLSSEALAALGNGSSAKKSGDEASDRSAARMSDREADYNDVANVDDLDDMMDEVTSSAMPSQSSEGEALLLTESGRMKKKGKQHEQDFDRYLKRHPILRDIGTKFLLDRLDEEQRAVRKLELSLKSGERVVDFASFYKSFGEETTDQLAAAERAAEKSSGNGGHDATAANPDKKKFGAEDADPATATGFLAAVLSASASSPSKVKKAGYDAGARMALRMKRVQEFQRAQGRVASEDLAAAGRRSPENLQELVEHAQSEFDRNSTPAQSSSAAFVIAHQSGGAEFARAPDESSAGGAAGETTLSKKNVDIGKGSRVDPVSETGDGTAKTKKVAFAADTNLGGSSDEEPPDASGAVLETEPCEPPVDPLSSRSDVRATQKRESVYYKFTSTHALKIPSLLPADKDKETEVMLEQDTTKRRARRLKEVDPFLPHFEFRSALKARGLAQYAEGMIEVWSETEVRKEEVKIQTCKVLPTLPPFQSWVTCDARDSAPAGTIPEAVRSLTLKMGRRIPTILADQYTLGQLLSLPLQDPDERSKNFELDVCLLPCGSIALKAIVPENQRADMPQCEVHSDPGKKVFREEGTGHIEPSWELARRKYVQDGEKKPTYGRCEEHYPVYVYELRLGQHYVICAKAIEAAAASGSDSSGSFGLHNYNIKCCKNPDLDWDGWKKVQLQLWAETMWFGNKFTPLVMFTGKHMSAKDLLHRSQTFPFEELISKEVRTRKLKEWSRIECFKWVTSLFDFLQQAVAGRGYWRTQYKAFCQDNTFVLKGLQFDHDRVVLNRSLEHLEAVAAPSAATSFLHSTSDCADRVSRSLLSLPELHLRQAAIEFAPKDPSGRKILIEAARKAGQYAPIAVPVGWRLCFSNSAKATYFFAQDKRQKSDGTMVPIRNSTWTPLYELPLGWRCKIPRAITSGSQKTVRHRVPTKKGDPEQYGCFDCYFENPFLLHAPNAKGGPGVASQYLLPLGKTAVDAASAWLANTNHFKFLEMWINAKDDEELKGRRNNDDAEDADENNGHKSEPKIRRPKSLSEALQMFGVKPRGSEKVAENEDEDDDDVSPYLAKRRRRDGASSPKKRVRIEDDDKIDLTKLQEDIDAGRYEGGDGAVLGFDGEVGSDNENEAGEDNVDTGGVNDDPDAMDVDEDAGVEDGNIGATRKMKSEAKAKSSNKKRDLVQEGDGDERSPQTAKRAKQAPTTEHEKIKQAGENCIAHLNGIEDLLGATSRHDLLTPVVSPRDKQVAANANVKKIVVHATTTSSSSAPPQKRNGENNYNETADASRGKGGAGPPAASGIKLVAAASAESSPTTSSEDSEVHLTGGKETDPGSVNYSLVHHGDSVEYIEELTHDRSGDRYAKGVVWEGPQTGRIFAVNTDKGGNIKKKGWKGRVNKGGQPTGEQGKS
ncbi:unnamed protein product [Amoebophrya sp. A25]|nr:unnamed protein product [Amoebophrya sp. A25]|eukprot:GSA25T00018665001.1